MIAAATACYAAFRPLISCCRCTALPYGRVGQLPIQSRLFLSLCCRHSPKTPALTCLSCVLAGMGGGHPPSKGAAAAYAAEAEYVRQCAMMSYMQVDVQYCAVLEWYGVVLPSCPGMLLLWHTLGGVLQPCCTSCCLAHRSYTVCRSALLPTLTLALFPYIHLFPLPPLQGFGMMVSPTGSPERTGRRSFQPNYWRNSSQVSEPWVLGSAAPRPALAPGLAGVRVPCFVRRSVVGFASAHLHSV